MIAGLLPNGANINCRSLGADRWPSNPISCRPRVQPRRCASSSALSSRPIVRFPVIGVFAHRVGVVHDAHETRAAARPRSIAASAGRRRSCRRRRIGRRPMNLLMPTGLPALSSMNSISGSLHQHRLAVGAHLELRLAGRSDHLLGRDAVDLLGEGAHELDAAAGHDERLEAAGAQIGRAARASAGTPSRCRAGRTRGCFAVREPVLDDRLELVGRHPGMSVAMTISRIACSPPASSNKSMFHT